MSVAIFTGSPIFFFPFLFRHRRSLRRHHARMIPRSSSLAAVLPPLIVIALLSHLRLRKLLRRFVQTALGYFGWLPFHASFLITLCLKVNLKTSVITDNQKAEIIATLSTRLARKWERIAAGILFPGAE